MFFTERTYAAQYRARMRQIRTKYFDKTDALIGHEVDIYGINCKQVRPPFTERLRKTYQMWRFTG